MGPYWFRRGDHGRSSCSGSWPTTPSPGTGTPTATDSVAAEAEAGIAEIEAFLAEQALVVA